MANRLKEPDPIWLHWTSNLENNEFNCIYCQKTQAKHATRLKGHTARCKKAPQNVRNLFQTKLPMSVSIGKKGFFQTAPPFTQTTATPTPMEEDSSGGENKVSTSEELNEIINLYDDKSAVNSAENAAATSLSNSGKIQTTLIGAVHRLSTQKLKDLQVLFVKSTVSGSIPFNWLNDPYLREFFEKLGSGFTLPARMQASGPILDILEFQAAEKIGNILKQERHFSLVPDGWSNIKGLSVINIMIANPNVCIFLRSIETGEEKQTAAFLKVQLNQILAEICEKYGKEKICAIVSDQGANYLKARNEIALENDQIISINCAAHLLNLLAGDFCRFPSVQLTINQGKSVVKEIKNSKVKLGAYNAEYKRYIVEQQEKGIKGITEVSLSLPCVTRWLGIRLMIEKLTRARPVLERMALAGNDTLDSTVKSIIKNDNFWEQLANINIVILEITDGILAVESQAACISDVVEVFLKLKEIFTETGIKHGMILNALNTSEIPKSQDIFMRRFSDKSISLNHYIANLLDPRYRGERFRDDSEKWMNVFRALESYAKKVGVAVSNDESMSLGAQLTAFRMRNGYFETNMLNHPVPHLFWENYLQFPETRLLASIGCRLLSIPASSAGVERSFSVQAYMHNKSRNRLGEVKVDKMMRIKWCLNNEAKSFKKTSASVASILAEALDRPEKQSFEHNAEENEEYDVDEVIGLEEAFDESDLFEVAANSSTEAANPSSSA